MIKKLILLLFLLSVTSVLLSGAINISNTDTKSTYPQIAVDKNNNIHVVWIEIISGNTGDVFYTMYNRNLWTTPVNITNRNRIRMDDHTYLNVAIDCDTQDRVYVVWNERNNVRLRIKTNNKWGAHTSIVNTNLTIDTVRISVSDSNHVFLTWWNNNGVFSRAYVSGSWESIRQVSPRGYRAKNPDIQVGSNLALIAWQKKLPPYGNYITKYSTRSINRNAGWSDERTVYDNGYSQDFPRVAITSNHNLHAIYLSWHNGPVVIDYSKKSEGNFSPSANISNILTVHFPTLYSLGNTIYAGWQEGGYSYGTGYYYSVNSGNGWSFYEKVRGSTGAQFGDLISSPDNKVIYFVWNASGEIYFGSTDSEDVEEPIIVPNKPPVAKFSYSPLEGLYPLEVYFNGGHSTDSDGKIVKYKWNFGDGTTGSGRTIRHVFEKKGIYKITLTVYDNDGDYNSSSAHVAVYGISPPLNIKYELLENRNLFSIEYIYKITWDKNPINKGLGSNVIQFKIFRREKGVNSFTYFMTVNARENNEYFDRTLGGVRKSYEYNIVGVDTEGRESELNELINNNYIKNLEKKQSNKIILQ